MFSNSLRNIHFLLRLVINFRTIDSLKQSFEQQWYEDFLSNNIVEVNIKRVQKKQRKKMQNSVIDSEFGDGKKKILSNTNYSMQK